MPDLPDPVRMRQLLAWCGHTVMAQKESKADSKMSVAETTGTSLLSRRQPLHCSANDTNGFISTLDTKSDT
jgi:Mis12-Mtw1 protein family